ISRCARATRTFPGLQRRVSQLMSAMHVRILVQHQRFEFEIDNQSLEAADPLHRSEKMAPLLQCSHATRQRDDAVVHRHADGKQRDLRIRSECRLNVPLQPLVRLHERASKTHRQASLAFPDRPLIEIKQFDRSGLSARAILCAPGITRPGLSTVGVPDVKLPALECTPPPRRVRRCPPLPTCWSWTTISKYSGCCAVTSCARGSRSASPAAGAACGMCWRAMPSTLCCWTSDCPAKMASRLSGNCMPAGRAR